MRILFLSRWFPYPPNNGSKLRIYNILRGLAQHHEVTLLSFSEQQQVDSESISVLRSFCREVQVVPWSPFQPQSRRALLGYLSFTPRSMVDTFSPDMGRYIEQTLSEDTYDLVIASQGDMAEYRRFFGELPALFEEVEVGILYEKFAKATSARARLRHGLTWLKHRYYLRRVLSSFQACTVASENERRLVSGIVSRHQDLEVIPNGVNLADYAGIHETVQSNTMIFTGSFRYSANHDAMVWFLSEVYPNIQAQLSDARLIITGDHADLPLPAADRVTLTGFVDDVRPLIASAGLSLAPLRVGGGTRLKILEAMALGTPVVATSKGAEGLDVKPGEHLLISDTPKDFAEAVLRLLQDSELRQWLAANALRFVTEKYDWAVINPRFLNLVEKVAFA